MAKVLVVDDEPNIVLSLEFLMQQAGFDVTTALDGESALALVNENPPDLVLLDISLPGISGFEVLEQLRNQASFKQLPIVMLTALWVPMITSPSPSLPVNWLKKFKPYLMKAPQTLRKTSYASTP